MVIANAHVTPGRVSITLDESLEVDESTPPFKSFFLDRIIGEMKRKDGEAALGDSAISCVVNKDGTLIREIIVDNYRQRERADEIISTAGWSLNKMLDNAGR